jgi:hypothetical protein
MTSLFLKLIQQLSINLIPKMKPETVEGKPVNVEYLLPISLDLGN